MFNVGAAEFLVVLVVALVVLGPERLPGALRKVGQVVSELRKMSAGFQDELREALDEPMRDLQGTVDIFRNPLTALADAAEAAAAKEAAASSTPDPGGVDAPPSPAPFEPPSGPPVLMAAPDANGAIAAPDMPAGTEQAAPTEAADDEPTEGAVLPPPPGMPPVNPIASLTESDA